MGTWQIILNTQWLWTTLAWVLPFLAAAVLLWALFRDRPGLWGVPRERCPKCRYDMAGRGNAETPIVCPECGKAIRDGRSLRKTRRRWGMALLAVPLLVGWHLAERKEQIRVSGWLAAVPTPVLMVLVDPQEWFDAGRGRRGRMPRQPTNPGVALPSAAEHLHYRLLGSDLMMSLWLWRSRAMLEREGYSVLDIQSIADVERVTDENVWAYRNGPNWWSPGDLFTNDAERFRDGLTGMIDAISWSNNGGDWNIAEPAGSRLLIKAPPNTVHAARRLVHLIETCISDPEEIHAERVHGHHFVAFSIEMFADTDWYRERKAHWDRIGSTHTWVFGGSGAIAQIDPNGLTAGLPVLGPEYAASRFEWETAGAIHNALMHESIIDEWVDYGGESFWAMRLNGVFVIRCEDEWGQTLFEHGLNRIRDLGPDAILKEHGVQP